MHSAQVTKSRAQHRLSSTPCIRSTSSSITKHFHHRSSNHSRRKHSLNQFRARTTQTTHPSSQPAASSQIETATTKPQMSNSTWSHPADLLTTRTALALQQTYEEKRLKREHLKLVREQAETPLNVPPTYSRQHVNDWVVCDHCLLHNAHCVCDEFPDRQAVTDKLATLLDVVVYAHTNEVLSLSSSNTARFLPRHGAYSVIMGDYRGEVILKNLILSRPRDSVFVLFPSPTSITPDDFMQRFHSIATQDHSAHPFTHYPPYSPTQLRSIQHHNAEIDAKPLPLLEVSPVELSTEPQTEAVLPVNPQKRGRKQGNSKQQGFQDDPVRLDIIGRQLGRTYFEHDLNDLVDDRIHTICPTFSSSRDFYQLRDQHQQHQQHQQTANHSTKPHFKPLVIVLDGTWSNAKGLDRRLNLILNEVFEKNQFNERQLLLEPIPASPTLQSTSPSLNTINTDDTVKLQSAQPDQDQKQTEIENTEAKKLPVYLKDMVIPNGYQLVDPKTYLHRVRVTRAIRGDIGQLRRLQGSERSVITTSALEINKQYWHQANIAPGVDLAVHNSDRQDQLDKHLSPNTHTHGILHQQEAPAPATESTTQTKPTTHKHKHKHGLIDDDAVIEDHSGGRVSTLHAFLVMLEELYDLPLITSHRDLDIEQYQTQLKNDQQRIVLDLVESFATILQAMVIGYHTARGLQKAQLLDPEMRQKVKERYQKFLTKRGDDKQQRITEYQMSKQDNQRYSSDDDQECVKKQKNSMKDGQDQDELVHL